MPETNICNRFFLSKPLSTYVENLSNFVLPFAKLFRHLHRLFTHVVFPPAFPGWGFLCAKTRELQGLFFKPPLPGAEEEMCKVGGWGLYQNIGGQWPENEVEIGDGVGSKSTILNSKIGLSTYAR